VLEGDTLRSDGTTILGGDCKAGLAIVLEALACVVESDRPHRAVEVAFSRHEEGGLVGVHHMDFSLLTARTGIVLDGEGPPSRITVSAPSQNVVTAEIIGRAAHAGLEPENGLSALLVTAEILTRLPLGRIDAETTANIGWLEGGLKRNIVPERALLDGEFRSRSNDKLAWLEGQFRKVFGEAGSRYPDARISLDIRNTYQAYRVEPQHETVATIGHALDRLGLSPVMEASGGGSDANVFIERGITALPVGIGVRSFHTTWETALITEVLQGAEMCQAAILAVNGN
jgi:tripeptide aminopeptidase